LSSEVGAYEDTLAWLSALEVSAGWDLKLERMQAALARRGHPERRFPALHVAGTNGKGSVAAMVESILRAAGGRTALYTSPHLVDFAERMRIDGRTIPHATVVELVAELRRDLEAAGIRLTHFEFATLLGFEWFARVGVDVAVVEVGLGGRLDATNLVHPVVTVITSIARDHEEYLGSDLRSIAAEKAGIAKAGVPLVIGRVAGEAADEIARCAAAAGAPLVAVADDMLFEARPGVLRFRGGGVEWDGLRLALDGRFQRDNAAVALLALARAPFALSPDAVRTGLASVRWPGRLAIVRRDPLVLVDGAHNPAGVAALAAELPGLLGGRRATLVFAVMADKDWRAMLAPLLSHVARVIVTRVGRRAAEPEAVAAVVGEHVPVRVVPEPRAALVGAVADAAADEPVLVTGSLFLVGEAYAALGAAGALFEAWQPPGTGGTEAPS
jgi:dihydrofolate synthase/folylpolyglutamate synthase